MKRTGLAVVLTAMTVGAVPSGRAFGDEWSDPAREAVEAWLARREAARAGRDNPSWVTKRHDEVAVLADVARVDVTLEVTNGQTTGRQGLEWRRTLPIDPRADLIGAVYVPTTGETTPGRTLLSMDARRLYDTTTNRGRGRDPLWVTREEKDLLDVTIFPVPPGATVKVVLSFVTPLAGRGERLEYRDPLGVRPSPRVVTPPAETPPPAPEIPVPVNAPEPIKAAIRQAAIEAAAAPATTRVSAAEVLVRFAGAMPDGPPAAGVWSTQPDGSWRIEPPEEGDLPPLVVRSAGGDGKARVFAAAGYPMLTSAFAWRADPAAIRSALGVEAGSGTKIAFASVAGSSTRIAPEVLDAADEPTVVMGRAHDSTKVLIDARAIGPDGKTLATRRLSIPASRVAPAENLVDALRAYHRTRLAERVLRWAGERPDRKATALEYAVDVGALVPGVAVLAIPKSERTPLQKGDLRLYLTAGVPFDGDSDEGDFKTPPAGTVR